MNTATLAQNASETKSMLIGISGIRGSFTEMAARHHCVDARIETYQLEYLTFVENVLEALEAGTIDLGIFAIENRIGGVVIEYLPAILKHRCKYIKTFEYSVHQMLMVRPGIKPEDVTEIVSQKQALEQCDTHLRTRWKHVPRLDYIDTATAAKDLHEGNLPPTAAVVGSRAAAELYGLDVLEGPIQDDRYNYTTFIVAETLRD